MKAHTLCLYALTLLVLGIGAQSANAQEKFYYWVTPFPNADAVTRYESFVIELDAAQKAELQRLNHPHMPVVFYGQIAARSVPYNRNYHAAGQPLWNWHFTSIDGFYNRDAGPPVCSEQTRDNCLSNPTDIAADPEGWIEAHGTYYFPTRYYIVREIDPSRKDALANVSNRGMTGAGEKTLITGLIITGGEPRNVVVRALGPSLGAKGVQQFAANPRLEVYRGSSRMATNADWGTHPRAENLRAAFPTLVPENEREAALWLTLTPGAYTLHGINEDGSEGVVLLEAFDVDLASQ